MTETLRKEQLANKTPIQSSEFTQSLPYIIAFASASVANEWWTLVKKEYPSSERKGPQLFILKGEDMPYQIQDNLRFYHLRNKWFLLSDGTEGSTGVIPLQDWNGHPATASQAAPTPSPQTANTSEEKQPAAFDMIKLTETLSAMNTMISENSAQIRALSVAQSEGLRRMQEINETNATQIKALAENQSQLQSLLSQNASHYIALSNSSFQNQEQVKKVLQANAEQIHALAEGQNKMAGTCSGLMAAVAELGDTVARVGEGVAQGRSGWGDERGVGPPVGTVRTRISPPPRKLNRRIKSVWYEYDTSDSMTASPRRTVGALATPPMSPESGLGGKM